MAIRSAGFTIVELLVVIVVIAILAAVSVVGYSGIQRRANDTVIASDLKANIKRIQLYRADNDKYPSNPELWALPADQDLRMTISKKSLYRTLTYTLVATGWGQPTSDIMLEGTTPDGRTFSMLASDGLYRDITSDVASGKTTCQATIPTKTCLGGDGMLYSNGASQRIVIKAL